MQAAEHMVFYCQGYPDYKLFLFNFKDFLDTYEIFTDASKEMSFNKPLKNLKVRGEYMTYVTEDSPNIVTEVEWQYDKNYYPNRPIKFN